MSSHSLLRRGGQMASPQDLTVHLCVPMLHTYAGDAVLAPGAVAAGTGTCIFPTEVQQTEARGLSQFVMWTTGPRAA